MTTIKPDFPEGFIINVQQNTFVKEPPGNTKTVQEVLDENKAFNDSKPPIVLRPLTRAEAETEMLVGWADSNGVEITNLPPP